MSPPLGGTATSLRSAKTMGNHLVPREDRHGDLRDTGGLLPDHGNKANAAAKKPNECFGAHCI